MKVACPNCHAVQTLASEATDTPVKVSSWDISHCCTICSTSFRVAIKARVYVDHLSDIKSLPEGLAPYFKGGVASLVLDDMNHVWKITSINNCQVRVVNIQDGVTRRYLRVNAKSVRYRNGKYHHFVKQIKQSELYKYLKSNSVST